MTNVDALIVGGGVAGASAAKELRDSGFSGSIMLVTRELDEPYERPPVTKGLLRGDATREDGLIVDPGWWAENDVELRTRAAVVSMDLEAYTAKLASKDTVTFAHAILATGAMVRRLQVDGARLDGIHYLRAPGNADALREDVESARRVAIIGGSYVGCEVAATLTAMGKSCTIIMQEDLPLERGFGRQVGEWCNVLLGLRGVAFVGGAEVTAFEGEDRVSGVRLANGDRVDADVVVVGVGATPDVMLAKKAGLELGETGGIACSATLETSAPGIYAAGDACEYAWTAQDRRLRVEHHEHAAAQGRTAARNIAGHVQDHAEVPYFWTDLADWASLEYVGAAASWDEEEVLGDLGSDSFAIRYLADGRLVGALSCGRGDDLEAARAELAGA